MSNYKVGDLKYFSEGRPSTINIGGNIFANVSANFSAPAGRYPKLKKLMGNRADILADLWYRNPQWNNMVGRIFVQDNAWNMQDLTLGNGGTFATNGKIDNFLMVFTSNNTTDGIIVGNYAGDLKIVKASPESEIFSLTYYPPTDMWFLGGDGGKIYHISDEDLRLGKSPTIIPSTPIAGFTGGILIMHHLKPTGTLILMSQQHELARSTDQGVTWNIVSGVSTGPYMRSSDSDADGNMVIATGNGTYVRTLDDGLTWNYIPEDTSLSNTAERVSCNPNTGRFMVADGSLTQVITMDDANSNLRLLPEVFAGAVRNVQWCGDNTWFLTIDCDTSVDLTKPVVYRSDDDGSTWVAITLGGCGYRVRDTEGHGLFYDGIDTVIHMSPTLHDCMLFHKDTPKSAIQIASMDSGIEGYNTYMCVA